MKDDTHKEAPRTALGSIAWVVLGLVGLVYIINPSAGLLEFIPDNLPGVGNLDEATATLLVLASLKYLTGIDLTGRPRALPWGKKKS